MESGCWGTKQKAEKLSGAFLCSAAPFEQCHKAPLQAAVWKNELSYFGICDRGSFAFAMLLYGLTLIEYY